MSPPGLIDLQVNGFAGLDFNDGELTPERVKTLADHCSLWGHDLSADPDHRAGG